MVDFAPEWSRKAAYIGVRLALLKEKFALGMIDENLYKTLLEAYDEELNLAFSVKH